jgi:hypothetical protein
MRSLPTAHRRRRGFEPLGEGGASGLGVPPRQARTLTLVHGWSEVAGPALARRATVERLHRGVLTLAVADRRWLGVIEAEAPRLAGRLAALHPQLGIAKVRVGAGAPARPVTEATDPTGSLSPAVPAPRAEAPPRERPAPAGERDADRLVRIARRYVERAGEEPPR